MINLRDNVSRQREWLSQLRLSRGFERGVESRLRKEFTRVGKEAASAYETHGAHGIESVTREHANRLSIILTSAYVAVARAFAKRTLVAMKKNHEFLVEEKDTEAELEEHIYRFAKRVAAKRITSISNTTRNRINREISRGLADGKTPREIAGAISEKTGGTIGSARAKLISRTETHSAANEGAIEAAKSTGLPLNKEWLAVNDERTRDDHSEVSGTEIGMNDTFSVGDDELSYPGDPEGSPGEICNCRCVLLFNDR